MTAAFAAELKLIDGAGSFSTAHIRPQHHDLETGVVLEICSGQGLSAIVTRASEERLEIAPGRDLKRCSKPHVSGCPACR